MREQTFQLTDEEARTAFAEYLLKRNRIIGLPGSGWLRTYAWRERERFVVRVVDARNDPNDIH